jgi:hypothetical protein
MEEIQIPYLGATIINKFRCKGVKINLTDFIYINKNGQEYNMFINNKGDFGKWYILESIKSQKLYATNNLWFFNNIEYDNIDYEDVNIIDNLDTLDDLQNKYKNIQIINTFDFLNINQIKEVIKNCERSIEEYNKKKYIHDNTKLLYFYGDNWYNFIKLEEKPDKINIKENIYTVFINGQYGDCEKKFISLKDAKNEIIDSINILVKSIKLNKIDLDKKIIHDCFVKTKVKYLDQYMRDCLFCKYNLVLCYSKKINNYMKYNYKSQKFLDDIYIMSFGMFKSIKNEYEFNDSLEILNKKTKKNNISNGEKMCKDILKELYPNHIFEKIRPNWLCNDLTNHNLELDFYNEQLKLAIEYNGIQHYQYIPFFHNNIENFQLQKLRDEIKQNKCNRYNIRLIIIPYHFEKNEAKEYINNILNII